MAIQSHYSTPDLSKGIAIDTYPLGESTRYEVNPGDPFEDLHDCSTWCDWDNNSEDPIYFFLRTTQ